MTLTGLRISTRREKTTSLMRVRYACMSRPYVAQKAVKPVSDHLVLMADACGQVRYMRDDGEGGEEVVSIRDVVRDYCRRKERERRFG